MIYEIRTYRVKVGSLPEVEKRFGEAYEYRKKYSPLAAFWHTEIGPLNEIIHVWGYENSPSATASGPRRSRRATGRRRSREFIETMQSEIVVPFAFLPDLKPGKMGPYLRDALLRDEGGHAAGPDQALGVEDRGAGQDVADRAGRPRRARRGQPLHPHLGLQEHGRADAVRNKAREMGVWPPPGGGDRLISSKQDHDAFRLLAAPVALAWRGPSRAPSNLLPPAFAGFAGRRTGRSWFFRISDRLRVIDVSGAGLG